MAGTYPEWIRKYKKDMASSVTTGIFYLCRDPDTGLSVLVFNVTCNDISVIPRTTIRNVTGNADDVCDCAA